MGVDDLVRFAQPQWLIALAAPGVLLLLLMWQLWRRQAVRRAFTRTRIVPSVFSPGRARSIERISRAGDLLFWLCLLLALVGTILALARPVLVTSMVRTGGIDLVILQDGSASMRVKDVAGQDPSTRPELGRGARSGPDRWQRSTRFLRTLGESLRWEEDRIALALFATTATPQIRLTRDPNTFFFFLDHLDAEPPFRLQDAGTWDTNIEQGIYWGLRLIEKDEEIAGPTKNGQAFVLLSDGQAWSGQVERSIARARARQVPLYVIGVGTTAGGVIPEPQRAAAAPPLSSSLDRDSLAVIATEGGGRYFELDREPDAAIASAIIALTRARAPSSGIAEGTQDLHWRFLLASAGLLLLGILLLNDRAALALHLGAAAGTLAVLTAVL
jgi:Ca-activated chloride channel homolog